jgi:iron-sulfur cluster assembly accessory protein
LASAKVNAARKPPIKARKEPQIKAYVSKDTKISELAAAYPVAIGVLFSHGLHCVGCHASAFETLRQGAEAHGMKPTEIDKLVEEVNKAINEQEDELSAHCPETPVKITKAACLQLSRILETEGKTGFGLRLVKPESGPKGRFEMDFEQVAGADDIEFDCRGIRVIVAKPIIDEVTGAVIDFRETVQGSGFTIRNPNGK